MYIQASAYPSPYTALQIPRAQYTPYAPQAQAVYGQDQLILNTNEGSIPKPPPSDPKPPGESQSWSPALKIAAISAPVVAGAGIGIARGGAMGGLAGAAIGAAISYIGLWWMMTVGNPFD